MDQNHSRGSWGSNFGFLMAAVGSAVGLGNIWGFPFKMGSNGGFAFLSVYLILAVVVGMTVMLGELALGRKTGRGVVGTYKMLTRKFHFLGYCGVVCGFLILAFYSVLGGLVLRYCVAYAISDAVSARTKGLISSVLCLSLLYLAAFLTGILPKDTIAVTGIPTMLGAFGTLFMITNIGTLIRLRDFCREFEYMDMALADWERFVDELLPLATLVTPNIPEAQVLSGLTIQSKADMIAAAKRIGDSCHCAVLLKGGHSINDANDLLYANGELIWFEGRRIDNPNTHGTGCTLSSAIASNLAKGFPLAESVQRAKDYLSGALAAMLDLGEGSGPMNHAFALQGEWTVGK